MLYIGSWICDGAFSADQIDTTDNATASGYFDRNGTFWYASTPSEGLPWATCGVRAILVTNRCMKPSRAAGDRMSRLCIVAHSLPLWRTFL